MTGLERINCVLAGERVDRPPALPVLHTGLAPLAGVPLGRFLADAETMARVIVWGYRRFGFDGVHMSLGVTGEAEALGAQVEQPEDAGPILRQTLLSDWSRLADLRDVDPTCGGRMPLFFDAAARVSEEIGREAFVLVNLRGPLLAASQLHGVEQVLIDALDAPERLDELLDFTSSVALRLGTWLLASGAHGLVLGEATCSPNFISPALYRSMVAPKHRSLVAGLRSAGWRCVGLHICGSILPIVEDIVSTGVDFADVDYQAPAADAVSCAAGRIALRGNLDPISIFRFGKPEAVREATLALCAQVAGSRWIVGSGCDIPPGTCEVNIAAFADAVRSFPSCER